MVSSKRNRPAVMAGLEERSRRKAASEFLSMVTDDLLLEIFLHLPDARTVSQCKSVCKRWFSLLSDPQFQFIPRFNDIHNSNSYSDSAYSILFTMAYRGDGCCVVFSEKSKILHDGSVHNYQPNIFPDSVSTVASSSDLLLLASWPVVSNKARYFVYNPLTRQSVALPSNLNVPIFPICGKVLSGFFFDTQFKTFKVLHIIFLSTELDDEFRFHASLFRSETGNWTQSTFSCPRKFAPDVEFCGSFLVADTNGILYAKLTDDEENIQGFAAFDLRDDPIIQCRLIGLHPIDSPAGWPNTYEHVFDGIVRGQQRLSKLLKIEDEFVLNVWELNNDLQEWLLVHNIKFKFSNEIEQIFVAAFHPNNGDIVFFFSGSEIYEYKIGQDKYEKVGQFLESKYGKFVQRARPAPAYFWNFPIVHPPWPTVIPTLPSIEKQPASIFLS